MPIYSVDIACRSSAHDYATLFAVLRQARAQPFLDGRWLVDVSENLATLTQALLRHCAVGDGLFVTELAPETRWTGTGLDEATKAWLMARMRPRTSDAPHTVEHHIN